MWAIYVRVSKRDMNPENQLNQLEEYARRNGWRYCIFSESESTRKTRPVKAAILARLRKREFEGVLVWKLDRWARSLAELILELDEFQAKGIQFVSMTQNIDTTTASGRLMVQILGAFAEFERELIRERTMAGLDRARARGKHIGRPKKRVLANTGEGLLSEAVQ